MDGNSNDPTKESWGGSFEKFNYSPRIVFNRVTTASDTVAFCSIVEFRLQGPEINIPSDSICFWMETPYKNTVQKWPGYYLGKGLYALQYVPKQAELLNYQFTSDITGFPSQQGQVVVINQWPGKKHSTDYPLGKNWYTDKSAPELYDGKIQGGKTVSKWRQAALADWGKRWDWLK